MALVIIRHKVEDFAAWKKVFYGHASAQSASGLSNPRLFRLADDPNSMPPTPAKQSSLPHRPTCGRQWLQLV